jgi:Na+/H+ antiporter NhaC
MLSIAFILLFGFTMGTVVKGLGTGAYLSSLFQQFLTPALLPALTFLIAVLLSFATGTSMGTMAIMSVIALPMAIEMGISVPLVAGAMFGGSIFGDHTSPISDTTIMTCATTGCDIIDHVKTQAPYCVAMAVLSFVLYIVLGFVM